MARFADLIEANAEELALLDSLEAGKPITVCLEADLPVVRAGTFSVNAYSEGDITTPFGGFKVSGFGGRDKGLEAFDQYTEQKTVWISVKP